MSYHLLVIDDDPFQCKTIQLTIEKFLGFIVSTETSPKNAIKNFSNGKYNHINMVILDLSMEEMDGLDVLDFLTSKHPDIAVIINTAFGDINKAVDAVKRGAVDFIEKQDGPERMKLSIENARTLTTLKKRINKLEKVSNNNFKFIDIIGSTTGLEKTVGHANKAASSSIPVLLSGENGVGKELFARSIHNESIRSSKPFVAINCAAIPTNLVESTLFGHEKGAFTGAVNSSIGKFREANEGTIFLDEIGELPLEIQAKLLRVLQNYEIEPVGSSNTHDVNVRIVSATNKNLEKAVEDGSFREDLYYRINTLTLDIPPLRKRVEDIEPLIKHFIEKICIKENLSIHDYDENIIPLLQSYRWPGNVRQLENTLYRAIILSDNKKLNIDNFDLILKGLTSNKDSGQANEYDDVKFFDSNKSNFKTISEYEKGIIESALEYYNWNISKVSKILDIGRSTLYRKMKEYGIAEHSTVDELDDYRRKESF